MATAAAAAATAAAAAAAMVAEAAAVVAAVAVDVAVAASIVELLAGGQSQRFIRLRGKRSIDTWAPNKAFSGLIMTLIGGPMGNCFWSGLYLSDRVAQPIRQDVGQLELCSLCFSLCFLCFSLSLKISLSLILSL